MSDEEGSENEGKKREEPLPDYTVRFTDMPDALVEKAVRCKSIVIL
mgnify:CR=1 FL=1